MVVILHFLIKCIIFTFTFRSLVHFRWLVSEVAVEALFFFPMCISSCSAAFVEKIIHLVSYLFVNNISGFMFQLVDVWYGLQKWKNSMLCAFPPILWNSVFIYISILFRPAMHLVIKIFSHGAFTTLSNACSN